MSLEKQRRGQVGVNVVEGIVLRDWGARWQQIDSVNDDGVDGLIFLESGGGPTGQIIFVQVKCTKASPNQSGYVVVPVKSERLKMNMERWRRVVGAAILVHVEPTTLRACWVNLRDQRAFTNTQIKVPSENHFNANSRRKMAELCGTVHLDMMLREVATRASDFPYLIEREHIQTAARKYYRQTQRSQVFFKGSSRHVHFTREGWHHITRYKRPRLTQLQSFHLLGAVRRIIETATEGDLIEVVPKKGDPIEYVYLSAVVSFPFRASSVVKVVLRRRQDQTGVASYSFHTVYEPRRRRNMIGLKKFGE
ncbi:MAG: DUF4365 domain-containing protein [Kiloniellaceae bacterium]